MAVNRKITFAIWLLLLTALSGVVACGAPKAQSPRATHAEMPDPPRRAGLDTIAIVMPIGAQTREIWKPLVTDLSPEFNVVTIPADAGTTVQKLGEELDRTKAVCIVAMDNRTVGLYRDLQRARPDQHFPPAVILMTSFLDQVVGSLRDATGIAYEVPVVTSFVALREIAKKRVARVGVIYRRVFADVVAAQARLATVEKLTIVGAEVGDTPSSTEIDDALYSLIHDRAVDALWVLNDNALLTRDAIGESWLPRLHDRPLPVVVGVSALVHPEVHFGTVAVLPDHERLGAQAASLIFELADDHWELKDRPVELPLSVRTVVDVEQVRNDFGLQPGALKKIDDALE
jgi:hypothetical protein